ncbi:helix-turn-helix transcriptional regulator [Dactylosporangium aurantiacum]|uniref:helix-turn-helix transcriptional regulator n=1 Tax=Dactylosporangium aurantiacum TaxID=35754 RepID=UPI0007C49000|nr:helix-turn-helix transcriptional regulator [Dactylosporangium aurantiacum]MDG6100796.1 helix-turn-helix transcriptional regulator [Dactylosporangium aurantiacum]
MTATSRAELAAFLRSRRARITPADVGLPPGFRRRTPGLRREELAQLAGVGVTWYTWLEQGRAINASVQVLDAIARTLRLDEAEREHLYRLADVPAFTPQPAACPLEPQIQLILDGLALPACVYNGRYDLLAWNAPYARLFADLVRRTGRERNALWHLFVTPECCMPFVNLAEELPLMVATMRATFARHLGEPAWEGFVRDLSAASPAFAAAWQSHDVAVPGSRLKIFRHGTLGDLRLATQSMQLAGTPEARMIVYAPGDAATAAALRRLEAAGTGFAGCTNHREPA